MMKIERRQRAEGRGRKGFIRMQDRLVAGLNPPPIEDHQIEDFGGGFKPEKYEGRRKTKPSAFCPSSAASSAFQGGSLGKGYRTNLDRGRCIVAG